MGIVSRIQDGITSALARVLSNNAIKVALAPVPLKDQIATEEQQVSPYSARLADGAGSTSLNIDGSTVPVKFSITAGAKQKRSIRQIRFIFHSTNMEIDTNDSRRFGPVSAPGLPNGLTLEFGDGVPGDIFLDPVKVIGDFYTYSTSFINDKDGISPSVDYLMMVFDLGVSPVVLFPGTTDNIVVTVNDDLTGIALFEVFVLGTQETLR